MLKEKVIPSFRQEAVNYIFEAQYQQDEVKDKNNGAAKRREAAKLVQRYISAAKRSCETTGLSFDFEWRRIANSPKLGLDYVYARTDLQMIDDWKKFTGDAQILKAVKNHIAKC